MDFQEMLQTLIHAILVPAIPIVAGYVVALIKKNMDTLTEKLETDRLFKYINLAEDAITTAIDFTAQTMVNDLKNQGKFDTERQKEALMISKDKALKLMSNTTKQMIQEAYGDINEYIEDKIEQIIRFDK